MLRKCLLALAAVACMMASPALAEEEKTYVVVGNCEWPPLEFVDLKTKELVGFEIDYIKAVAKEAGIKITIRNTAWDGIFASLGNHQADIIASGVTVTAERKKTLAFAEPFMIAKQTVVVLKNSNVKEMKDLNKKKVGGQIGTTGIILTMKNAKKTVAKKAVIKTYDEVGLAFADLAKGNVDAVICDSPVAAEYAKNKPEYAGKMKIAFSTNDALEELAFVVRPSDKELLAKLNKGIKAVKANGTAKALQDKWGIVE